MSLPAQPAPTPQPGDAAGLSLEVLRGPRRGESFPLTGHATFFVGRGPGVHLAIEGDPSLSRVHFGVECNPPCARVVDMRSRNGTFLNNQKIEQSDLRDGDRIRAGGSEIVFRMAGDATAPPADASIPVTTAPGAGPSPCPLPDTPAVSGYSLERELGEGGMGRVYLARRDADGLPVAIKIILPAVAPRPEVVGRFQREVRILEQLVHPHIVRHYGSGEARGMLYFVMEYVDGLDAHRVLKEQGPLPPDRAVRLGCQLLDALAYAHDQGFVGCANSFRQLSNENKGDMGESGWPGMMRKQTLRRP